MRLAASGGVHGAMALNAFSQSVFMEAVASTLDRGAGAGAEGGGRMEGVPRLTWGADAAGGGAGGVQSERVSNPWRSGGRGDTHLGVGTSAGGAEGEHGAELHTPNWAAGGHEEAWSGGWSSTGHNQQQDFGGDGMGVGLAWP